MSSFFPVVGGCISAQPMIKIALRQTKETDMRREKLYLCIMIKPEYWRP